MYKSYGTEVLVGFSKMQCIQKTTTCSDTMESPLLGEIKINTVIAYDDLRATSGIVVRDHNGNVLKAWGHHFPSPNPYCAEMEVVIQAFIIAEEMKATKATFECDSSGVGLRSLKIGKLETTRKGVDNS